MPAARKLRSEFPNLPIVFLAPQATVKTVRAHQELGGHGFLTTPATHAQLIAAVVGALHGEPLACQAAAEILGRDQWRPAPPSGQAGLTQRERFVMDHPAKGWQDKDIAAALGIAVPTAHNHRTKAYRKLGVRSRSEAVRQFRGP